MPRIHPAGWRRLPVEGATGRRIDTLRQLEDALPDDFIVFHGVHWARGQTGENTFGQADFIIVGPGGCVLLMQQVDGFLEESTQGLLRRQRGQENRISTTLTHDAAALRARLTQQPELDAVKVDVLLYCPDHQLRDPGSAGLDPNRIVDTTRRAQLGALIRGRLQSERADADQQSRLERFFADTLALVPEVNALVGQARALYTRLSGGLTEWARKIDMHPFRLRITGTAGSGKTQLAQAVFRDATARGQRVLYVCYNRPLADHMACIVPSGGEVASYHQLCHRRLRAGGRSPDFSRPDVFRQLEHDFASLPVAAADRVDVLIVDEGQDFRAEWLEALLRHLKADGQAWWLEDPLQNLYARPDLPLQHWVRLYSDQNYRSPADVLQWLNQRLPLERAPETGSPLAQSGVEVLLWEDETGLFQQSKRAITRAIGLGFRREHIALVSFRGREHSCFTPLERLGPHSLKRFTGRYDLLGSPLYSEGELLIDSVYRFKGQAAPAIIFTEIDFETLDSRAIRKLFVGATRAGMKLIMVMSRRAARQLNVDDDKPDG